MTEEQQFLQNYKPSDYKKPSVTADIVIFTVTEHDQLAVLLIKRNGHPYKDKWAIPGGFLNVDCESLDETAARELQEETGVTNAKLTQLYTFSKPDRDPRMHVISTAYTALVPKDNLHIQAGDDAKCAELFVIQTIGTEYVFLNQNHVLKESEMAFDHKDIIRMAITRLKNRIQYEPDAFALLKNPESFTIYELKRIYETILNTRLDNGNFRKQFHQNYLTSGIITKTGQTRKDKGRKEAALYCYHPESNE